jgi:hypothetical protein
MNAGSPGFLDAATCLQIPEDIAVSRCHMFAVAPAGFGLATQALAQDKSQDETVKVGVFDNPTIRGSERACFAPTAARFIRPICSR